MSHRNPNPRRFAHGCVPVIPTSAPDGYNQWVKRYLGEPLPPNARVAVISNDALGNYVVVTPLLQMIRARWPQSSIHYFGGQRTAELWQSESLLATGNSIFGPDPRTVAQ